MKDCTSERSLSSNGSANNRTVICPPLPAHIRFVCTDRAKNVLQFPSHSTIAKNPIF